MKRFAFSLEKPLQLKQQLERMAELQQQKLHAIYRAAQAEVEVLQERLALLAEAAQGSENLAGVSPVSHLMQAAHLARFLEMAETKARQAAAQAAEADRLRSQRAIEVEVLLTLKRQQEQTYHLKLARARQATLDEVGLQRWLAKKEP